jgi:hypothetical protein
MIERTHNVCIQNYGSATFDREMEDRGDGIHR